MPAKPMLRDRDRWSVEHPSVLIFDVSETLIDFESMSPLFERLFGDRRVMREWFGLLTTYSMTLTLCGLYKDFWALGGGLFQMVGAIHGVNVSLDEVEALRNAMKTMPAHKDAPDGLRMLKDAGFRMVTLTNSPPSSDEKSPLEHAGLDRFFERQYSIDAVRAYKPAPLTYHVVTQDLDVAPGDCCLVSAHVWDTIGGQAAGMASALVTRPGAAPLPIAGLPQPNAVAADLPTLAKEMIRMWPPATRTDQRVASINGGG